MASKSTPADPTPADPTPAVETVQPETPASAPTALGSTFAERKAARLGLPMPEPTPAAPATSTFAERRAARQAGENRAVQASESK